MTNTQCLYLSDLLYQICKMYSKARGVVLKNSAANKCRRIISDTCVNLCVQNVTYFIEDLLQGILYIFPGWRLTNIITRSGRTTPAFKRSW